jgi:hypothetical protein
MAAVKSQGTKVYVKNATTFAEITGIQAFSMSGGEADKIDTTALGDTSPSSVRGMESALSVSMEINYDPTDAVHILLDGYKTNVNTVNYKVIFPSASNNTKYFTGEILSFPELPSADRNSTLKKTLQLTVNNIRNSE